MKLNQKDAGVFYVDGPIVAVGKKETAALILKAASAPRARARLCAHRRNSDKVHEMIIVLKKGSYIRPHTHSNKVESFHVIKGRVDVVTFSKRGVPENVIRLGDYRSGLPFFLRMHKKSFHTLVVKTPNVIFHETTNGPFVPNRSTMSARWSPADSDGPAVKAYMRMLNRFVRTRKGTA